MMNICILIKFSSKLKTIDQKQANVSIDSIKEDSVDTNIVAKTQSHI